METIWNVIERAPASAAAVVWKNWFGRDFDAAATAFLRKTERRAGSIPCPDRCGCGHRVVQRGRGFVGVCACEDVSCDDLTLTAEDIAVWDLNRERLASGVAKAFGCEPKPAAFAGNVMQVGTFGATSLPIMLLLGGESGEFQAALAGVVARLRDHFVILAPTRRFFDARTQELVNKANAGLFDLESHLRLAPAGALKSNKTAGELFSAYLPDNRGAVDHGEAQRVFGILRTLKSKRSKQKAPLYDVFVLSVLEGHSQKTVAGKCECSPGLISGRVKELEKVFGRSVRELQALATPIREMQASVKGHSTSAEDPSERDATEEYADEGDDGS
jgi:hypothetical protein